MLATRRYQIRGIVQGVGFRPFVYRTAEQHSLVGWIRNDSDGVEIEIQGDLELIDSFILHVRTDAPALARVEEVSLIEQREEEVLYESFTIQISERTHAAGTLISPDTFVCEDCLRELFDPGDRRYRYPFINCTNCGPRYSIIRGVPYDRPLTTMASFPLCEACEHEYHDVADRRFHAQPVACWDCGPNVQLVEAGGALLDSHDPIAQAAALLRDGGILACKGIGGYHLMADPTNVDAVDELRRRKHRDEKPFALMSPSLEAVERYASVGAREAELLTSVPRPIVLVKKRTDSGLAEGIAPGNRRYGVMLAYTPLHHLLLSFGFDALVATSGNLSDEPIAFTNEDALDRLAEIADAFLINDRDIYTRVDDSIVRSVPLGGQPEPVLIRRARGYAPEPIAAPFELPSVLAVGPELKNTVCLSRGNELFLSHHIGDLKNDAVMRSFGHAIEHLQTILEVSPELVAHDLHPAYMSTRFALSQDQLPTLAVQHHHAHMAACMCEHGLTEPVIGVIFDGTGYGTDGAIWGGEFLVGDYGGFQRAGQLDYFRLPGGDKAVKQPYRVALSLLAQAYGSLDGLELPVVRARTEQELMVLGRMVERGIHSPISSSMGRLFDGVAALIGVREEIRYEAQAAIELEQLIEPGATAQPLPWELRLEDGNVVVDPRSLVRELADEVLRGRASAAELSLRFHCTVVEMVRSTCLAIHELTGLSTVVLSGGVFLNEFLLSGSHDALVAAGFDVRVHRRVPTNDGGVALGQAAIAGWRAR
ncbi:MAG TPA: carbamoyltransferase HypF [Thermoleophilaceae bacterium]